MSINPVPSPKPVPWGKKYRTQLMNTSFWLFWMGFPLAYVGATSNDDTLMGLSFLIFCVACVIPLVTKK